MGGEKYMLYRIFTELKNEAETLELVSKSFDGFTVLKSVGFWRGIQEESVCFEVITDNADAIFELAKAIKANNAQESVLVEALQAEFNFI